MCSIFNVIYWISEVQASVFGEKLKQQVEDRLKFYECGDIPKKNIDVMKEAMEEAALIVTDQSVTESTKKKKKVLNAQYL